MEIPNYYKDTCVAYNRAYNVISLEEYKAKMLADVDVYKRQGIV